MNECAQRILLLTAEREIDRLGERLLALNRRVLSRATEDVHDAVYEAADVCLQMAMWKGIRREPLQKLARAALSEFVRSGWPLAWTRLNVSGRTSALESGRVASHPANQSRRPFQSS